MSHTSGFYTAVNKGESSSPAAVITGKTQGNKNIDLVVVPEGILINEYPKGLDGVDSEHFVEIPAIDKSKKAVAFYHSFSEKGSSSAFFTSNLISNIAQRKFNLMLLNWQQIRLEKRTNF